MPNLRRHPTRILQAPLLLLQQIRLAVSLRREWEVIHANWSISLLAGWISAGITRRPFVVTLRGEDMRLLRIPLLRSLLSFALRRASAVISVNQEFLSEIRERAQIATERCLVIPNGVAYAPPGPEALREFLGSRNLAETPYLLFVGSVIPRKRIELLIEALARPQLQSMTLVVCGRLEDRSYVDSLKEQAERLRVRNRIRFEGATPPSHIPLYLEGGVAFVSASEFEGRPNAMLEALAAGKFVLASDIPAHREILRAGENGALFHSPEQLAEEYARWTADPAALAQLQLQAQASVSGQSWERCARQYLECMLACCREEVTVK